MTDTPYLKDLIEGMEFQTDESRSFFNRKTGRVVTVTDEQFQAAETEESIEDMPEWMREAIDVAKDVLSSGDYIELPSKYDIHEYSIMERFCLSLGDQELREEMYRAIKGKGAFRRFKEGIHRNGIAENWYQYRDEALRRIAIDWCEEHGIGYIDVSSDPKTHPEGDWQVFSDH